MENASKALIMAAGILIGVAILSLAVYLFVSFGSASAEIHEQNDANRINEFNTQFTSYVGKEDITIYDVITVANLATENNIKYEYNTNIQGATGKNSYISVYLKQSTGTLNDIAKGAETPSTTRASDYNKIIQADINKISSNLQELTKYDCTVDISETTGLVYKVTFSAKK